MAISNFIPSSRIMQPGVCTSSTRPASPYEGQAIYETDTDKVLVWNGSIWTLLKTNIIQPVEQPAFFVMNEGGSSIAAVAKATFNSIVLNTGSCWSSVNNRFTAPITGNYEFSYSLLNAISSGFTVEFRKNGSAMTVGTYPRGYSSTQYVANVASGIIALNANDYIEIWVTQATMHNYHCHFSGKLVS